MQQKLRTFALSALFSFGLTASAQTPVYLDDTKPIEQRVEDALSRMTLDEKIGVISDWGGTHDTDQAVKNGLDMEFGTWTNGLTTGASNAYDNYYLAQPYKQAILSGKYTEKELNDKVRRVLRLYLGDASDNLKLSKQFRLE